MKLKKLEKVPVRECNRIYETKAYQLMVYSAVVAGEVIKIVDIYYSNNEDMSYRLFVGKDDWIIQNRTFKKWSHAKLSEILGMHWWNDNKSTVYVNENIVAGFFNLEKNNSVTYGLDRIDSYLSNMQYRNRRKSFEKELLPVTKTMYFVPKLPKDFYRWIKNVAMASSAYATTNDTGCYCWRCKKNIPVKASHRQQIICPKCGEKLTVINSRQNKYIWDEKNVALIQKYRDGFVLRLFRTTYRLQQSENKWAEGKQFYEIKRVIFNNGMTDDILVFKHDIYKQLENTWNPPYKRSAEFYHGIDDDFCLYTSNIKETFQDSAWKYSGIKEMAETYDSFEFSLWKYLYYSIRYSCIEFMAKRGLGTLLNSLLHDGVFNECSYNNPTYRFSPYATKQSELLHLEKNDIDMIVANQGDTTGLQYIQYCRENNLKPIPNHMVFAQEYFHHDLKEFFKLCGSAKPGRVIHYLQSNKRVLKASKKDYIGIYQDYLRLAGLLKYDTTNDFVVFPKNLIMRHDMALDEYNTKQDEKKKREQDRQYKQIVKRYTEAIEKYGYKYKKLIIDAPKKASDLTCEGQNLHHCVGGYVSRVANGETTILFIRQAAEPDKSFYTLEVKKDKVVQCKGLYNKDPDKEVAEFLKHFKEDVLAKKIDSNLKEAV